jgi:hypothetical protein
VNPFVHKKGTGARICKNVRMDVLPNNAFSLGADSTIEDFSVINNGVGDVHHWCAYTDWHWQYRYRSRAN